MGAFPLIFVPSSVQINQNEGYTIVVLSWLLSCLIGTLPYILYGGEFTFTNAWFESVSGYTTTGSTILTDIEILPKGILFWRASTHWIGGIGIVIFVMVVLPSIARVKISGSKFDVTSLAMDNFNYRTKKVLQIIVWVYVGLTIAETILLTVFGMSLFDSICHSFATIATGGFSTKNLNIAYYNSVAIDITIIVFMILSGIHFGLLYNTFLGDVKSLVKSEVVRFYIIGMIIGVILIACNIHQHNYQSWNESFRFSAFQVASLATTTGFANANSNIWPGFSILLLLYFTLQCACAGSTAGGIKVDRVVILIKSFKKQFVRILHPNAVVIVKIDNNPLKDEVIESAESYIIFYLLIVFATTCILTVLGVDLITSFSGSATTMGNVGSGFGQVYSLGNFSEIPTIGKWVLSANMLLGRLEIYGLLLIFALKSLR
jgi:trk system potassium uptake protein TrkH